jgi:membrane protein
VDLGRWLERARTFATAELWSADLSKRRLVRLLQLSIMVGQGFVRDRLLLRASALAYFTVLSLIPLLAVAVSIVGAVGVGSTGFVDWAIGTVAAGSVEAQQRIRELIEGASFAGLGSVGAAVLFVTTVLAISNVERALNDVWGVAKARSWRRRFPDYLAVLVVGPLLGGVALSLAPTMRSEWVVSRLLEVPGFALLYELGLRQAPTVLLGVALTFLYWFLPNTSVRPVSALVGAIPAALLTVAAQTLYVDLSVGVARANAFFGSFALLPLLLVWIYLLWAIVLLGAEIAFAHQNLRLYRLEVRGTPAGPAARESIALGIALEVARRFAASAPALDAEALSEDLDVPVRAVRDVAERLLAHGILSLRAGDGAEGYQLGRPAERIRVADVLAALRGEREHAGLASGVAEAVEGVLSELDEAGAQGAGARTLAELLDALPPEAVAPLHSPA